MRHFVIKNLILISLLTFSVPSFALGKLGHQLTCQLAYELLTPKGQITINAILSTLPKAQQKTINRYNKDKKDTQITFAKSCTWADAIKKQKRYAKYKSWHYVNLERNNKRVSKNSCEHNCVTSAITTHLSQLIDATSPLKKREALMFLSHWLGDLHQPLHVSFASDLGGNKSKVMPWVGKCNNLHWYWDECLLYPIDRKNKTFNFHSFKKQLYQSLTTQLAESPVHAWQKGNVIDWANESFAIIKEESFQYCQFEGEQCLPKETSPFIITETYHTKHQKIIYQQILKAAVRLAFLLENNV